MTRSPFITGHKDDRAVYLPVPVARTAMYVYGRLFESFVCLIAVETVGLLTAGNYASLIRRSTMRRASISSRRWRHVGPRHCRAASLLAQNWLFSDDRAKLPGIDDAHVVVNAVNVIVTCVRGDEMESS